MCITIELNLVYYMSFITILITVELDLIYDLKHLFRPYYAQSTTVGIGNKARTRDQPQSSCSLQCDRGWEQTNSCIIIS